MHFLFNLRCHSAGGERTLEDVVVNIARQLETLGHTVERCNAGYYATSAVNVVVEGFMADALPGGNPEMICHYLEEIRTARAQGARFVLLATEQPTSRGFNFGVVDDMVTRQAVLERHGRGLFDAIWSLVEGEDTLAWYRRLAPATFLPLGFAPQLVNRGLRGIVKDHDFGFYGSAPDGGRRLRVLARFNDLGFSVRIVRGFEDVPTRDREMARCHVLLQIKPNDQSELISSSRIATGLLIGADSGGLPIVAEYHKRAGIYANVIDMVRPGESFIRRAIQVRRTAPIVAARQFTAFQRLLSPEACVGRALRETGMLERAAA